MKRQIKMRTGGGSRETIYLPVPADLRRKLQRIADNDATSLNQVCIDFLAAAEGQEKDRDWLRLAS